MQALSLRAVKAGSCLHDSSEYTLIPASSTLQDSLPFSLLEQPSSVRAQLHGGPNS